LKGDFYFNSMGKEYSILGLMSGTSLDGLDVAICNFVDQGDSWQYSIIYAETVPYPGEWKASLAESHKLKGTDLIKLDRDYGTYIANIVNSILKKTGLKPQLIASHGHTVFHSPADGYTLQIGHGANINVGTKLPVISDFRSADVALGGQGAPLVPVGDKLLFSEYDACLNLGGFANVSFDIDGLRRAYDICPVNIIINRFAELKGLLYDKDGLLGRKGHLNESLLFNLDNLEYYNSDYPKSLSREWLEEFFIPGLESVNCSEEDRLHTVYNHIAGQIAKIIEKGRNKKVLVTGGGAYNTFLLELIRKNTSAEIVLPDKKTIEFKEALVFAFLGLLKYLNRINCLSSATGASRDSSCGTYIDL
jgi:anhydro-N-acetylmuramic acid kinase